jgi:hypothetical protein
MNTIEDPPATAWVCATTTQPVPSTLATTYEGQWGRTWVSTVLGTPSTSAPSEMTTAASNIHHAPVGAIVGGVVGGLAVLSFFGIAVCLLVRKRRVKNSAYSEQPTIRAYQQPMSAAPPPTTPAINFQAWQTVPSPNAVGSMIDPKPSPPVATTPVSAGGSSQGVYTYGDGVVQIHSPSQSPAFSGIGWSQPPAIYLHEADANAGMTVSPHHRGVIQELPT